jgi:hypothetical protein
MYHICSIGSPRNVTARTRLYSPFGLGSAVDFSYHYLYRAGMFDTDQNVEFIARARPIGEVDAKKPLDCGAITWIDPFIGGTKPRPAAIKIAT